MPRDLKAALLKAKQREHEQTKDKHLREREAENARNEPPKKPRVINKYDRDY